MNYTIEYFIRTEKSFSLDEDEIKNKYYEWLGDYPDDCIEVFQDFIHEYLEIESLEIECDNLGEIYKVIKK